MQTLWQDIRYGMRMLAKSPGFTAVAVLTLALGIGANATLFSLYNAIALRPLPVKNPASVVALHRTTSDGIISSMFSYPDFADYRRESTKLRGVVAYAGASVTFTPSGPAESSGEKSERLSAQIVSGNYFDVLESGMAYGRAFLAEEDQTPGAHPVAVLNHRFWQRRFGGDPNLIGRAVVLNSLSYTVIGITPKTFIGADPETPDVWVPVMMADNINPGQRLLQSPDGRWLRILGRLRPGAQIGEVQAELTVLASRAQSQEQEKKDAREGRVLITPATYLNPWQRAQIAPATLALMAAVGLVLLIACANVANLQMARGSLRRKELAVRVSLGASRGRIVSQLIVESLLLSCLSGFVGILFAWWASDVLVAVIHPPGERAFQLDVSPDWRMALYILGAILVTANLFGLLPALRMSKRFPAEALKDERSSAGAHHGGTRVRGLLIAGQVAMSLFLLVGAGLLVRALRKAEATDPGFEMNRVAVLTANLRVRGYDSIRAYEFDRRLLQRVSALAEVEHAAVAFTVPLGSGFSQTSILPENQPAAPDGRAPVVDFNVVSPEFFETLGIPVVRGRSFNAQDLMAHARFAVVSESLARRYWPGQNPLGKKFSTSRAGQPIEIVGVARDVRNVYLWSSDAPYVYLPTIPDFLDNPDDLKVLVRSSRSPIPLLAALPGLVHDMDPSVVTSARTLADNLSSWIWPSKMGALLASILGTLALVLAMAGVYSVTAYAVAQRTQEIGIRMALGAQRSDILWLVFQSGMIWVGTGVVAGLAGAAVVSRVLSRFLYGLSTLDAIAFAEVTLLLTGVAFAACWIPARRATRVDPMVALRYE